MSDFKAKMHRNPQFGWGSAPDPLDGFRGPTSKGRGGESRGGQGRGRQGTGRQGSVVESQKILKIDHARKCPKKPFGTVYFTTRMLFLTRAGK